MIHLSDFREILEATAPAASRGLLLGNGFSIGACPAFSTAALAEGVQRRLLANSTHPHVAEHFASSQGPVENRIAQLQHCPHCVTYLVHLRQALIDAILETSPTGHSELPFSLCCGFSFLAQAGQVFTLNYDLLLYWLVLHRLNCSICTQSHSDAIFGDGFAKSYTGTDGFRRCRWRNYFPAEYRPIYFIHGAMHLIAENGSATKLVVPSGDGASPFPPTLSELVQKRRFKGLLPPLFIAEATPSAKMGQIEQNEYLRTAIRCFSSMPGHMIAHGVGFNEQDEHLWQRIEQNDCLKSLNVGIYGGLTEEWNQRLIERVGAIASRHGHLTLRFYQSQSAPVWTPTPSRHPVISKTDIEKYFR